MDSSDENFYCKKVVEAIDRVTKQLNKPTIFKIARYLYRNYKMTARSVVYYLQCLLRQGKVIEHLSVGEQCYRNFRIGIKYNSRTYKPFIVQPTTPLSNAIAQLIILNREYFANGVPVKCLQASSNMTEIEFSQAFARELATETLIRLSNNNIFFGPKPTSPITYDASTDEQLYLENDVKFLESFVNRKENGASPSVKESSFESTSAPTQFTPNTPDNHAKDPKPSTSYTKRDHIMTRNKNANAEYNNSSTETEDDDNGSDEDFVCNGPKPKFNSFRKTTSTRQRKQRVPFDPSTYNRPKRAVKSVKTPDEKYTPQRPLRTKSVKDNIQPDLVQEKDRKENGFNCNTRVAAPEILCAICFNMKTTTDEECIQGCMYCHNIAHVSCVEDNRKADDSTPWCCIQCVENKKRKCGSCSNYIKKGNVLYCSYCHECYHFKCQTSYSSPNQPWRCYTCRKNCIKVPLQKKIPRTRKKTPKLITRSVQNAQAQHNKQLQRNLDLTLNRLGSNMPVHNNKPNNPTPAPVPKVMTAEESWIANWIDKSIPDATNWSTLDVYDYFCQHFSAEVAKVFKEQEIDGFALLLMRKSDVINQLKFSFDVATQILYHVRKLQVRRSDLKLICWSHLKTQF